MMLCAQQIPKLPFSFQCTMLESMRPEVMRYRFQVQGAIGVVTYLPILMHLLDGALGLLVHDAICKVDILAAVAQAMCVEHPL